FQGILLRERDEIGPDGVADAAAARMQHHPRLVRLVEAQLDEVVAAAERAQLVRPARALADAFADTRMAFKNSLQLPFKRPGGSAPHATIVVLIEADRHISPDLRKNLLERRFVEIVPGQGK